MSTLENIEWMEDAKDDFDSFVAERNWVGAQAIIDNLWEQGFNHEAEILRRALLRAQYESVSPRKIEVKDETELVFCDYCSGVGHYTIEIEDFIKDKDCKACGGSGLTKPKVEIHTFNSSAFSVLKSQLQVISNGLTV